MPEVSVIVPVYKVEDYLCRCIDSILAQTFTDFELILVDDGSSDRCPQICDRYSAIDSRVRVIHQRNCGQATARNNAIRVSQGKWICFVDSDDLINPYALEYLYNGVMINDVKLAACSAIEGGHIPDTFQLRRSAEFQVVDICDETFCEFEEQNKFFSKTVWAKLIARECVIHCLFDDGRIYEDNVVVPKWLHDAGKIAYSDTPLYFYFLNQAGTVRKKYSIQQLDNVWAKYERFCFFKDHDYHKMSQHAFMEYIRISAISYSKCLKELQNRDAARNLKAEFLKTFFRYRKYAHFDKKEKMSVFECFHPRLMNIYYLWLVLVKKIKTVGIRKTVKVVISKLRIICKS